MKDYLAYRTKDSEGDIWCEQAFVFESRQSALSFFKKDNPDLIELFTDENDRTLYDFEITAPPYSELIKHISFRTKYAGEVKIYEMSKGYFI